MPRHRPEAAPRRCRPAPHPFAAALLVLASALPLPLHASARRDCAQPADLVLRGGRVFTADSLRPWAQAVAVRRGRIVVVGDDRAVSGCIGRRTRVVPLDGRVVIPGINDAHDHVGDVLPGTPLITERSPTPDPPSALVRDSLRAAVRHARPGTWIVGQIGLRALGDTTFRRDALDAAAPQHPVALFTWWGHPALINSSAMRRLEITESVRDPLGGWYERDARGRLTGRVDETAKMDIDRRIRATMPMDSLVRALRAYSADALAMGVTSVQVMATALPPALEVESFRRAALPQRVHIIRWSIPDATSLREVEWTSVAPREPTRITPRLVVAGRKWVLDGTPVEGGAVMRTPWPATHPVMPGGRGRLLFSSDTLAAMLRRALAPSAPQLMLHVAGDSVAPLVLRTMERLAPDEVWRSRRLRLEHADGLTGADIARAQRLGVVVGQPRAETAMLGDWDRGGLVYAYGADGLRNPWVHLLNAITGAPQRVTTREAWVTAMTRSAAFAEGQETTKGTLREGMLADLVVLSQDVFQVPVEALPATRAMLVVIGGAVVVDGLGGAR